MSAKRGRPSDYSDELAAEICLEIGAGAMLRDVCKAQGMPHQRTVFRWLASQEQFSKAYARALENRTQAMAEEILEIADDAAHDFAQTKDGREIARAESVQRSKLRIDTRKWLMGKMAPKKYGDLVASELTGKDGDPIETGLSDVEAARRVAFLLASALKTEDGL